MFFSKSMAPTPFHPTHTTPFKSSLSSSQQARRGQEERKVAIPSANEVWPVPLAPAHLDPRDWTYLAEGGKNLLLKYTGPDNWPFVAKDGRTLALRLTKSSRGDHADRHADVHERIDPVVWQERIVGPALTKAGGRDSLPTVMRVMTNNSPDERDILKRFLRVIAAKIETLRPMERRKRSGINEDGTEEIYVTENVSAIRGKQTLVFEIKPKCGFVPHQEGLLVETGYLKAHNSRYRMHRILKSDGNISPGELQGLYDPLDLYSQEKDRISKASRALHEDWAAGSQYANLRVFLNEKPVKADNAQAMENSRSFVSKNWPESPELPNILNHLMQTDEVQLVLSELLELQRRFDPIDIEGVDRKYRQARGKGLIQATDEPEISLDEYAQVVEGKPLGGDTYRSDIARLLLSTMFKDCSILIRCIGSDSGVHIDVHVVDLDPKPISKLPHLWNLDQEVVQYFAQWVHEMNKAGHAT